MTFNDEDPGGLWHSWHAYPTDYAHGVPGCVFSISAHRPVAQAGLSESAIRMPGHALLVDTRDTLSFCRALLDRVQRTLTRKHTLPN